VIEAKNYQGTIYGGKERKTWSVNGKIKMMNPLMQNYGHIQSLKSNIESTYHHLFISIVSFSKKCTFKVEPELRKITSNELIIYDVELTEYINRKIAVIKLDQKEPLLKQEEILAIYNAFKSANIIDPTIREQHRFSIQNQINGSDSNNQCVVCNQPVSEKVKAYCLSNNKFNNKIYCYEHQKNI
jgi:hypothetical protein